MKFRTPSRSGSVLILMVGGLVVTSFCVQQYAQANSDEETTTKLVTRMISRFHVKQEQIDDDKSARTLDRYLDQLDPQKLYFMQSDIDEFNKSRTDLDDQLKAGDVKFGFTTFHAMRKKANARYDLADKLIDSDFEFTKDESYSIDRKKRSWAKTEEEISERWRKRIKSQVLSLKLQKEELPKIRRQLHLRYENFRRTLRQTGKHEILELYLSALTHSYDPHSSYMSKETLEDFEIAMRLELQGIGATLGSVDGFITVASIVKDGAAYKDGRLEVDDKIIGVDKGDGTMVNVIEMKTSKAVRLIRGKAGKPLILKVKKSDKAKKGKPGEVILIDLVRQVIKIKSAEVKGRIIKTASRLKGKKGRIGVIDIPSFYRDFRGARLGVENFKSTSRDVLKVLNDFHQQGDVDGIIIDLRHNGGGALAEAIEVSGLFIDEGPIVQVKELTGKIREFEDLDQGIDYSGPLVVLVNRMSASASEIFAGAIKDYRRGIVVGDKTTHGKGTVQNVLPVTRFFQRNEDNSRGALKLTINQYYRVNGDSTQNRGVESDIVLPSLFDHMDLGESFLDNSLAFDRIREAEYDKVDFINSKMIEKLKKSSIDRVKKNTRFQKLTRDIEIFDKRKNRKFVSLNYKVRLKEREELKKDDDDSSKDNDKDENEQNEEEEKPIFDKNYYNDEVLAIALEYAELFRNRKTAKK